ncbi:MAG TPA: site-2 protease family protein [Stellaceae bacterium]|nr:site-2 protease family protein [Stellaceae bacterium]
MMPPEIAAFAKGISVFALPVIFAVTLHEAAHGFVAYKLGDDTAWRMGRVTFNPIKHIDLFGTIILPLLLLLASFTAGGLFMFGYAKPVPVRFDRLNHPRRDMVWVALAGPATNLALAILSALLLYAVPFLPGLLQSWTLYNLKYSIEFNILIGLFNMIPLPPLDGGRVAVGLLPDVLAIPLARTERYGMLILITLLFFLPLVGQQLHMNLNVITFLLEAPYTWLQHLVFAITGLSA